MDPYLKLGLVDFLVRYLLATIYWPFYENVRHKYATVGSYRRRHLLYDQLYTICRGFVSQVIQYDTNIYDIRVAGVY